ncbi:MAG: DUF4386 domain-containing protein [Ardenticatenaceae bacterium]|nr:DUF4386 domain-containing protein [Ardenticatenaceae bacterium]
MSGREGRKPFRRHAIIVGVLFIIATVFLYIGEAFYGPYLGSPDYLDLAYPNRITVVIGMLLEFACVISIPLIPLFMFPILKEHSEHLALGYIGFRFFEAVFFVNSEINKLSLIDVSQGYLNSSDTTYFQNLGQTIQSENAWGWVFYVIVFCLGALMFNAVLYQSRLVPRLISAWGFLAAALLLVGTVLVMFELDTGPLGNIWELIFAGPIAVQEMVFAVWLIVKGFAITDVEPALPAAVELDRIRMSF